MSRTRVSRTIRLPRPSIQGRPNSLEETLAGRRSVREFTDEPLTEAEISQLLWAAQGVTDGKGLRTAPSAGALYPLELYVAMSDGFYKYNPARHALTLSSSENVKRALGDAALAEEAITEAPVVFLITAVLARTQRKYGQRAERYVHLEVGHAAQNILLQAVALGLGAVPIAAFNDDQISDALRLPANESPLYLLPVGHPVAQ
jgi:SagB-type dehydrogenase family enzyme